ncbi:hypothetical protein NKDENANG_03946 [Candidatus Entotheonellaceae bacterium PAL068K]
MFPFLCITTIGQHSLIYATLLPHYKGPGGTIEGERLGCLYPTRGRFDRHSG